MAKYLHDLLKEDPIRYTFNELKREDAGADIAKEIKDQFPEFIRKKDMEPLLIFMIETGMLDRAESSTKGTIPDCFATHLNFSDFSDLFGFWTVRKVLQDYLI